MVAGSKARAATKSNLSNLNKSARSSEPHWLDFWFPFKKDVSELLSSAGVASCYLAYEENTQATWLSVSVLAVCSMFSAVQGDYKAVKVGMLCQ